MEIGLCAQKKCASVGLWVWVRLFLCIGKNWNVRVCPCMYAQNTNHDYVQCCENPTGVGLCYVIGTSIAIIVNFSFNHVFLKYPNNTQPKI